MELIVGFPLDRYVRESKLDVRESIELVARIADAVHHAHQKGVIHRDLKPANVLVDASGQPKVLDLGIARITDSDLDVGTRHTTAGQILGALPYMSPEQVQAIPRRSTHARTFTRSEWCSTRSSPAASRTT